MAGVEKGMNNFSYFSTLQNPIPFPVSLCPHPKFQIFYPEPELMATCWDHNILNFLGWILVYVEENEY